MGIIESEYFRKLLLSPVRENNGHSQATVGFQPQPDKRNEIAAVVEYGCSPKCPAHLRMKGRQGFREGCPHFNTYSEARTGGSNDWKEGVVTAGCTSSNISVPIFGEEGDPNKITGYESSDHLLTGANHTLQKKFGRPVTIFVEFNTYIL